MSPGQRQRLEQGDRAGRRRHVLTVVDAHGPLVPGPLGPLVPLEERQGGPLVPQVRSHNGRVSWPPRPLEVLARALGGDDGGRFQCPLPGHHGFSSIGVPPGEPITEPRLLCCSGRWRSLGEMRATIAYGEDRPRSNIEIATWTRRLAYDLGALVPKGPPRPGFADFSLNAAHHLEGVRVLIALRRWDAPSRPFAWSVRFAAAWCNSSNRRAHEAQRELLGAGMLKEVDSMGAGRSRIALYEVVGHR